MRRITVFAFAHAATATLATSGAAHGVAVGETYEAWLSSGTSRSCERIC